MAKLLGTGLMQTAPASVEWTDIEVARLEEDRAVIRFHEPAATYAHGLGISAIHILWRSFKEAMLAVALAPAPEEWDAI